jgi:hypothetical protein
MLATPILDYSGFALGTSMSLGFVGPTCIMGVQCLVASHTLMPGESAFFAEVVVALRTEHFSFEHLEFDSFFATRCWTKAFVIRIGNIKVMSVLLELLICILSHNVFEFFSLKFPLACTFWAD